MCADKNNHKLQFLVKVLQFIPQNTCIYKAV